MRLIGRSVGAGTVEFIMDAETGEYFFMEMCVTNPILSHFRQWSL